MVLLLHSEHHYMTFSKIHVNILMTSPLCIPTLSKSILVLSLFRFISIHNCSTSSSGVVQNSSNTFHPFLVVSKIYSFPGSTCLLIKAPHSNDWQNLGATSTGKTSNSSLDKGWTEWYPAKKSPAIWLRPQVKTLSTFTRNIGGIARSNTV